METIVLDCGYVVTFNKELDGGGIDHRHDFVDAITNKRTFKRACEWCAGMGIIGFDLLGNGICDHIVFTDIFEPAIITCNQIAIDNNIQDKVTGYVSNSLDNIPETEKWDLVVANPPHAINQETLVNAIKHSASEQSYSHTEEDISTIVRITVDENLEAHTRFFQNLPKYLTNNAEVFISVIGHFDLITKIAEKNGLTFIGSHPAKALIEKGGTSCKILHFKNI